MSDDDYVMLGHEREVQSLKSCVASLMSDVENYETSLRDCQTLLDNEKITCHRLRIDLEIALTQLREGRQMFQLVPTELVMIEQNLLLDGKALFNDYNNLTLQIVGDLIQQNNILQAKVIDMETTPKSPSLRPRSGSDQYGETNISSFRAHIKDLRIKLDQTQEIRDDRDRLQRINSKLLENVGKKQAEILDLQDLIIDLNKTSIDHKTTIQLLQQDIEGRGRREEDLQLRINDYQTNPKYLNASVISLSGNSSLERDLTIEYDQMKADNYLYKNLAEQLNYENELLKSQYSTDIKHLEQEILKGKERENDLNVSIHEYLKRIEQEGESRNEIKNTCAAKILSLEKEINVRIRKEEDLNVILKNNAKSHMERIERLEKESFEKRSAMEKSYESQLQTLYLQQAEYRKSIKMQATRIDRLESRVNTLLDSERQLLDRITKDDVIIEGYQLQSKVNAEEAKIELKPEILMRNVHWILCSYKAVSYLRSWIRFRRMRRELLTAVRRVKDDPRLKDLKKRNRIILEILSCEDSYINHLCLILETRVVIEKKGWASSAEILTIYDPIETILYLHLEFQRVLEEVTSDWPAVMLGAVLTKMARQIRVIYPYFLQGYSLALQLLQSICNEYPEANTFLSDLAANGTTVGMDIKAYYISPIQKLPRYVLLVRELLKNTISEHVDYNNLATALATFKVTASELDAIKTLGERRLAVLSKLTCLDPSTRTNVGLSGFFQKKKLLDPRFHTGIFVRIFNSARKMLLPEQISEFLELRDPSVRELPTTEELRGILHCCWLMNEGNVNLSWGLKKTKTYYCFLYDGLIIFTKAEVDGYRYKKCIGFCVDDIKVFGEFGISIEEAALDGDLLKHILYLETAKVRDLFYKQMIRPVNYLRCIALPRLNPDVLKKIIASRRDSVLKDNFRQYTEEVDEVLVKLVGESHLHLETCHTVDSETPCDSGTESLVPKHKGEGRQNSTYDKY